MHPLFSRFPKLAESIPCESIAQLPTPVQHLNNIHTNLWMKCDNLTHTVYGGNKIRKLEFIIPELKRKNIQQVISLGGTGTNSGTALAMITPAYPQFRTLTWPIPVMIGNYYGDGYGLPTVASRRAAEIAEQHGIALEQTYTAKGFAAALDAVKLSNGNVLFWNTHSSI